MTDGWPVCLCSHGPHPSVWFYREKYLILKYFRDAHEILPKKKGIPASEGISEWDWQGSKILIIRNHQPPKVSLIGWVVLINLNLETSLLRIAQEGNYDIYFHWRPKVNYNPLCTVEWCSIHNGLFICENLFLLFLLRCVHNTLFKFCAKSTKNRKW
jgi:hypothetical protein